MSGTEQQTKKEKKLPIFKNSNATAHSENTAKAHDLPYDAG